MSGIGKQEQGYVKSALITGLLCVAAFTAIVYGVLRYQAGEQLADIKIAEQAKVRLTSGLLTQIFDYAANDLRVISKMPATEAFNRSRTEVEKDGLKQVFRVLLEQKAIYSQIRFLDGEGAELVRLDYLFGRSLVTPEDQLQSKSTRYYFANTMSMSEGDVYVSPLDLNVENGKVDAPYLPMVRFGVPVFDDSGQKQGAVILNMLWQSLLDTFKQSMGETYPAYLLNSDGGVLSAPDKNNEWGFMFGLPSAFKREHPQAWQLMLQSGSGNVETPDGLFVFETVRPLEGLGSTADSEDYFWKAVSFLPHSTLPTTAIFVNPWVVGLYLAGVVLLLVAVFYFQFSRHKRRELRRENTQQARRFWKISSVLGDGLIVMDSEGVVTYINPEAERILGWSSEEIVARQGHDVFHVHEGDESSCSILNVMNTRELYRSKDEEFRRKDNATIPVILNAAPLTSDTGEEGVVISFQDFSEIKEYQEKIHTLAYQDILTGLPNRRALDDRLSLAIALSRRHSRYLGLMFLDLDHFKEVNDTLGHDAGDSLLKEIATRLQHCVRETDTVARMGGDEFIILLPEVSAPENAITVAEKIIKAVAEPVYMPEGVARVGVSIGIVVARGAGVTNEGLMQSADAAMYEAKRAGKNRFFISEHPLLDDENDSGNHGDY
ncbi:diguanylate cyclase domain-containing protein [Marinobacter sp. DY40_1A1]|uniref:diguanylate cyclase domain-containing protein n=1 Tax=Marinobacter sp. DY40_1A1 TaxID=2583229 RepID=UPI001904C26E|nr:diguanylate cyclase [Marinobacter sp. DY40_1A1]MBK1887309.1 diguanylate cyclase [Marinobacter sp. DY40_1A1]